MTDRLLDVAREIGPRWEGSVALVPVDCGECPRCMNRTRRLTVHQAALLRHGGYGATERTTYLLCDVCDWSRVADVTEVRPDRRSA